MSVITVEWLFDSFECDCCGVTYAEGAKVSKDGEPLLDLSPAAHCMGSDHYDAADVYRLTFVALGHTITEA